MTRVAHTPLHREHEVRSQADAVIGWRCTTPGCRFAESVGARTARLAHEAADAEERAERERRAAEAHARREAIVDWTCEGCATTVRLPLARAQVRRWCRPACGKRAMRV